MRKPYSLRRLAVMRSYVQHSAFCSELSEQPIGWLARCQVADIPSPYRYSPSIAIWKWHNLPIIWFETSHKTYEAFLVEPVMLRFDTDDDATDYHIEHIKKVG
jgi:hypothetical protein